MKRLFLLASIVFLIVMVMPQGTTNIQIIKNYFYNYEIFYLSDFDFNDGRNNFDIFSYTLLNSEPLDVRIKIEFEMIADVPALGLDNKVIFRVLTTPFTFKGNSSITITTKDIDLNMDRIYYDDGTPLTGIDVEESEYISEDEFASIQQVVFASGRLPAGTYSFFFKILNEEGAEIISDDEILAISNPTSLELIAPGGAFEDQIQIQTLYPIFQWESAEFMWNEDLFPQCGYWIRICEYDPAKHSSVEEALNDDSNLPFPDNGGYYRIPPEIVLQLKTTSLNTAPTTFQYPLSGAKPLEQGKYYVWQVKKVYPTTSGPETVESEIFVFKVFSAEREGETNIYLQLLEQIIGTDTYENLFSGELNGFLPTGVILLNDTQQLTQDQLQDIANGFLMGNYTIQNIRIE